MAFSSLGPKREPRFADGDAPDVAVNATQSAAYAAEYGNHKEGTDAARQSFPGWEGLFWSCTDTKLDWKFTNGAWATLVPPVNVSSGKTGVPTVSQRVYQKVGYVTETTNGAGTFPPVVFASPFPNGVIGAVFGTIAGSAQIPVINGNALSTSGFTAIVPSAPGVAITYFYVIYGY